MKPRVVVDADWPAVLDIPPPKISDSAGAELTQFVTLRDGSGAVIALGCVATPIPGWLEEMRPTVEGRTVALAGAAAASASRHPVDLRSNGQGGFEIRAASRLEDAPYGNARIFLGFDAKRVHTCFATCGGDECKAFVNAARLEGSDPPPSPGLVLGTASWAVHHSRPFAAGAGILIIVAGILAVVLRRRPRFSVL